MCRSIIIIVIISCCVCLVAALPDKLINVSKCRSDEVFRCEMPCPGEKSCWTRDETVYCPDVIEDCVNRCVCRDGMLRSDDGSCISNEQCDKLKCPGDHEHFECASECDNVCATLDRQNKTNCPIPSANICTPKCYCNDGYARNDQGKCVLVKNCGDQRSAGH
ncbi:unnamed protein product [Chrysodeixis includens]|uniref:TIL domain-containing protein n=1 Tax=Chrysodeixis includens TaxID=689277 RepID=A0A9P0FZU1_CHRIL|nr:unnamed protein product [Chrysodeixis includens]